MMSTANGLLTLGCRHAPRRRRAGGLGRAVQRGLQHLGQIVAKDVADGGAQLLLHVQVRHQARVDAAALARHRHREQGGLGVLAGGEAAAG